MTKTVQLRAELSWATNRAELSWATSLHYVNSVLFVDLKPVAAKIKCQLSFHSVIVCPNLYVTQATHVLYIVSQLLVNLNANVLLHAGLLI
jgi:hypothetical protein